MSTPARPSRPVWYSIVAILASMLAVSGASVLISDHTASESERKWCSLVSTLDDAYRATPPQTPIGQRVASDIAALRRQFDCPTR